MKLNLLLRARSGRPLSARGRRRGTTLIETALCLGFVLLPLVLGGLQFGLVLTTTHALEQISREAGRFAAAHYTEPTFGGAETQGDAANSKPSLTHYLRDVSKSNGIPWNDIKDNITVSQERVGDSNGPQAVTISITYPMRKRVILGKLGFMEARDKAAAEAIAKSKDGKGLPGGIKDSSLSLSSLRNDYTVSSTFLVE